MQNKTHKMAMPVSIGLIIGLINKCVRYHIDKHIAPVDIAIFAPALVIQNLLDVDERYSSFSGVRLIPGYDLDKIIICAPAHLHKEYQSISVINLDTDEPPFTLGSSKL